MKTDNKLTSSHHGKARQQLMALEFRTKRAVSKLDTACDQLRELESELEHFLNDYYAQVGSYVEELHDIEKQLMQLDASYEACSQTPLLDTFVADTHVQIMQKKNATRLTGELKSLYRTMVKDYHPDMATGSKAVEQLKEDVIRTINDAYARRNLGELYKLKFDMEAKRKGHAMDKEDKVALYEQRYGAIDRALQDVDQRKARIMSSPAYQLMQRALEARLAGKDLIATIIHDLQQQIRMKQRRMVTTKIRKLYMEVSPSNTSLRESHGDCI